MLQPGADSLRLLSEVPHESAILATVHKWAGYIAGDDIAECIVLYGIGPVQRAQLVPVGMVLINSFIGTDLRWLHICQDIDPSPLLSYLQRFMLPQS